jgi:hypothetical protein
MPIILATQEAEMRRFKASLGKQFTRPYLEKQPSQKEGWWCGSSGGTPTYQCLPSKSSNLSTTPKKKKSYWKWNRAGFEE